MKRIEKWKEFKNIKNNPLIVVPKFYEVNGGKEKAIEWDMFDDNFAPETQIVITGSETLAPVSKFSISDEWGFKKRFASESKKAKGGRRDPLFWLNWPVNDIDRKTYRRIFLGKGEMLEKNITNLKGIITNPMEEAYASKNAIFAILDYSWNTQKFDANQSWIDGFKYFEPDAYDELREIASHMVNQKGPTPWNSKRFWGIKLSESTDLKVKIDKYDKLYQKYLDSTKTKALTLENDIKILLEQSKILQKHYTKIIYSIYAFEEKSKQKKLKEEILKYTYPLLIRSQVAINLLQALDTYIADLGENNFKIISKNTKLKNKSKLWVQVLDLIKENKTIIISDNKQLYPEAGYTVIRSHVEKLIKKINDLLKENEIISKQE
ncbi:beta-N-acetylglucosaminidase domain-containing protein [Mycoplasmopsis cricetuli]|uniref:beta-N-acetylglucosaminidase domain-containing protein n=1 Tax=Mycoplasmopsis cricetuli TaxID=171283 RepID=UPI000471C759|nr:beta-N-acetylglucosaminidase domain-containing protein [Mycoplasmopsis cricetuli]